jgi:hypothetical protein
MPIKTLSQSQVGQKTVRNSQVVTTVIKNFNSGTLGSGGSGPSVTSVIVTNSGYNNLDDTAAATSNSYIRILGTGFQSTANVFLNGTMVPKANVTFTSSSELRAALPVSNTGNYTLGVFNSNTAGALFSNTFVISTMPQWLTASPLANVVANIAFSVALSATSDSSITYSNTTVLPTNTTLLANGYFYGNVTVGSTTTYSFDVKATDTQNQDTTRTFTLPVIHPSIYGPPGQQLFTTTTQSIGDYSYFTVPNEIYSISAVVVGGGGGGCRTLSAGGGGSGGDLRWIKSIDVTPGETLRIDVGRGGIAGGTGGDGYFSAVQRANGFVLIQAAGGGGGTTSSARAQYGTSTTTSGTGAVGPIGGGTGGTGGGGSGSTSAAGGGGAGGYLGNGGSGTVSTLDSAGNSADPGSGAGGGGGSADSGGTGGTGGGVGLLGWGSDGVGGAFGGYGGTGGYSGTGGSNGEGGGNSRAVNGAPLYGSGGGGDDTGTTAHNGAQGAVRLIWPAEIRYYPYTRTADE